MFLQTPAEMDYRFHDGQTWLPEPVEIQSPTGSREL